MHTAALGYIALLIALVRTQTPQHPILFLLCCCCCLQTVELPLKISQTAAILEVVHSATGLVRSPVGITGEHMHVLLATAGGETEGFTGSSIPNSML